MNDWYHINTIAQVDSPALIVYPQRVKENIDRLIQMVGDTNLIRPHVKTNKIAEVCSMMLAAGITRFKCATIAEAEMLGMIEAPDVLIAHQPAGPKMERLLKLVTTFPKTHFTCIIDNFETAKELSELFTKHGQRFQLYIDLNIGMNRSGIIPENALQLFKDCQSLPSVRIIGLHGYDGHIRDTDLAQRNQHSDEAFSKVDALHKELEKLAGRSIQIVAGGSPSFPTHIKRKGVQFSPGTFVFWDWGYKHLVPDEPFEYAALVVSRIISIINETTICTDLGHKSVAAENPLPRVHFLNAPDAIQVGQSEEHLVMKVPDSGLYKVGDVLYGVPVHICPTVALYDSAVTVENNEVVGNWKVIARTRKITI
jgi:D-serine deaminase-like pyridoxal phosphate-dependent protein